MGWLDRSRNTDEATIGDGKIKPTRKGQLAMASPDAQKYFVKIRKELALAKVSAHSVDATAAGSGLKATVSIKIQVDFNDQQYKQKLRILEDGNWEHQQPRPPIDLEKDSDTKEICCQISEQAKIVAQFDYNKMGDPVEQPERIVFRQIVEVLKPELREANLRLTTDIINLMVDDEVRIEARRMYEDVIRERVQGSLHPFEKIGPEALHRFIDELYCKKIHDS